MNERLSAMSFRIIAVIRNFTNEGEKTTCIFLSIGRDVFGERRTCAVWFEKLSLRWTS